jgi:hypothetical protein
MDRRYAFAFFSLENFVASMAQRKKKKQKKYLGNICSRFLRCDMNEEFVVRLLSAARIKYIGLVKSWQNEYVCERVEVYDSIQTFMIIATNCNTKENFINMKKFYLMFQSIRKVRLEYFQS